MARWNLCAQKYIKTMMKNLLRKNLWGPTLSLRIYRCGARSRDKIRSKRLKTWKLKMTRLCQITKTLPQSALKGIINEIIICPFKLQMLQNKDRVITHPTIMFACGKVKRKIKVLVHMNSIWWQIFKVKRIQNSKDTRETIPHKLLLIGAKSLDW